MNKKKYHGINISLGSIRNARSSGVGEYLDLIPLIAWTHSIGFDIIQLLPLNDSGGDSSPYSALSAQALHPIYISLWALPHLDLVPQAQEILEEMRRCNSSKRYNYGAILQAKKTFLQSYFEHAFFKIKQLPEFQAFVQTQTWLTSYSIYKVLKKQHQEKAWWDWDLPYRSYSPQMQKSLQEKWSSEIEFYTMVQYFAFSQMKQVKQAAVQHQILIKGDIPILINRDSADVWANQNEFILDLAAGAPPDMYSNDGQYWGFPLFNWAQHEANHFSWWKLRLQVAEQLYDIYRIDHIVGFFRIWAIPHNKSAKEGFYLPHNKEDWIPQGRKILEMMLASARMLPIGEDLGNVPDEVRACMKELHIPGTKVMRWERHWHTDQRYIPVNEYPIESMTTISTHDSQTFVEWWEQGEDDALLFADNFNLPYESPIPCKTLKSALHVSHRTNSQFAINLLQEYLMLFPELCWDDHTDERINIPGKVVERNWTYRMRPFIDDIMQHKALALAMRSML